MFKSPLRTVFVVLSFVLIALCSGLLSRHLIVKGFHSYVEGERLVQVRLVSSDLEGTYDRSRGWNREVTAEDAARALMLGLQVKVVDGRGEVVMDTDKALALLPSERKARALADSGFTGADQKTEYRSYPLMNKGVEVGRLEVKFLRTGAEDLFIRNSSGTVVLATSIALSMMALLLGIIISRKYHETITEPVHAAIEDNANVSKGIEVSETLEQASRPEMPGPRPEVKTAVPSQAVTEKTLIAAVSEEEPKSAQEDALDAEDEDMQPLSRDGDRITKIVKGLEELAKAQALGSSLQKRPIELAQYLNCILEQTRGSVLDKDITFNLECDGVLSLSADPDCLTGIMTNLLDNAVKAVKRSGTISVSAAAKDDAVVFTVKDTGTGISKKALPHIFEQFYRGSGNGIGLGLVIVKELVGASRGMIDVRSTRGAGTIVTVSLPNSPLALSSTA